MPEPLEKVAKSVDEYLNEVQYIDDPGYIPSDFALEFINFLKLVNGGDGEENETPVLHYRMLDQIAGGKQNIANMVFRGSGKTSVTAEYLFLYIGTYGSIPGFGKVELALYVSDSIENGVKNMRKNLEHRWENSDFLKTYIPQVKFTDIRWEFTNATGNVFIVKGFGAKTGVRGPLALDEKVYTDAGTKTIETVDTGDYVYCPDGTSAKVLGKSPVFHDDMYELEFADGRVLKVNHSHLNPLYRVKDGKRKEKVLITTEELVEKVLKTGTASKFFTKVVEPVRFSKKDFPVEPYLLGILLGDGQLVEGKSPRLRGMLEDIKYYKTRLCNYCTKYHEHEDTRANYQTLGRITILGVKDQLAKLGLQGTPASTKQIPKEYLFGSIEQRRDLLAGLLDTGGSCTKDGRITYSSVFKDLIEGIAELARSLGYYVSCSSKLGREGSRKDLYVLYIRGTENPFYLPRKAVLWRMPKRFQGYISLVAVRKIPTEPSQCILVDHPEHEFITTGMLATHNTKELGKRPKLAVLDDIVSDEDAKSPTIIANIEDTIYKAVEYALHPSRNKIIWSGTPFNSRDPLYKAVESGAWYVNVYPVCEKFPCRKEDFRSAWPDRFTYEYVLSKYNKSKKLGKIDTFNQEMMLRIMSDEERLVTDSDILWYARDTVLRNKGLFNFYITTDFATSEKTSSDFSVISVWAYNNNGDWLWVDGVVRRQLMDQNINDLFRFVGMYRPQEVGVEISGQQKGFISWIRNEMLQRNVYFSLASDLSGSNPDNAGIRPSTNKLSRFNIVLPMFKAKKIYFPEELKDTPEMREAMEELSLASVSGFKSKHDDFIDTVSMLGSLKPWKPTQTGDLVNMGDNDIWGIEDVEDESTGMESYVV